MLQNYLKIAWKVLGRNRFFTFVSLFGISFTLAVLIIITAFLSEMLGPSYPETNRNRLLYINRVIQDHTEGGSMMIGLASFHLLNDYMQKLKTPEAVAIVSAEYPTNTFVGNRKLRLALRHTDATFWQALDFTFLSGGPYYSHHISNGDYVAVINKSTQEAYFGKGVDAVGKTITTDNISYRVIGVVKDVPIYQNTSADIYVPYSTSRANLKKRDYMGDYMGIILAKNPKDFTAIQSEINEIVAKIPVEKNDNYNRLRVFAYSRAEYFAWILFRTSNDEQPSATAFYGAIIMFVLLFMLLPTLNLVNINTSRIMERASEIGVRKAFGASRGTLMMQFMIENIILTLLGGAIGLGIAALALNIIQNSGVIPYAQLSINFTVVLTAIILCIIFGLLSGVLPALRMSRMQVVQAIRGG